MDVCCFFRSQRSLGQRQDVSTRHENVPSASIVAYLPSLSEASNQADAEVASFSCYGRPCRHERNAVVAPAS